MKQLNTLQAETCKRIRDFFITLIMFLLTQQAYAQTTTKFIDIFIGMQYGLSMVIPIAGAVIFLFLLLIYLFRIISKATFIRWSFSVIVAGAAFYISALLFYIT
ncbi:conjugal transfer protein [Bartonella sp. 220]|uniref:conjugal transfer protein n=1 Tax=Bartonella sp. 220B TaxID=2967260 RepID=UPI0022A9024D|nr:conjugal transfer protein [Bartonella sp. 220B]MCZ2157913.1 conjugal transfer protein [Bartonella sp. 220B]